MKQNWRKGDLFKIDWEKLISAPPTFGDRKKYEQYQRSRQAKFGDRVWEALRVEHRILLIHETGNGDGWTGTGIQYAIPVKKGKP